MTKAGMAEIDAAKIDAAETDAGPVAVADVADVAEAKRRMRREGKAAVAKLPEEYCKAADEKICYHIAGLPEYEQADTIFCFVGTASEIDTIPILLDAWKKGKRVCVPRCAPKCEGNGLMDAYQIHGMDDLKEGSYGILEPAGDCHTPKLRPEEINLAIVPCLSCSTDGKRLGYGGGYYDRYLERVNAPKAVLCRKRLMREDIPVGVHDLRMDMVVCEDGVGRQPVPGTESGGE